MLGFLGERVGYKMIGIVLELYACRCIESALIVLEITGSQLIY